MWLCKYVYNVKQVTLHFPALSTRPGKLYRVISYTVVSVTFNILSDSSYKFSIRKYCRAFCENCSKYVSHFTLGTLKFILTNLRRSEYNFDSLQNPQLAYQTPTLVVLLYVTQQKTHMLIIQKIKACGPSHSTVCKCVFCALCAQFTKSRYCAYLWLSRCGLFPLLQNSRTRRDWLVYSLLKWWILEM